MIQVIGPAIAGRTVLRRACGGNSIRIIRIFFIVQIIAIEGAIRVFPGIVAEFHTFFPSPFLQIPLIKSRIHLGGNSPEIREFYIKAILIFGVGEIRKKKSRLALGFSGKGQKRRIKYRYIFGHHPGVFHQSVPFDRDLHFTAGDGPIGFVAVARRRHGLYYFICHFPGFFYFFSLDIKVVLRIKRPAFIGYAGLLLDIKDYLITRKSVVAHFKKSVAVCRGDTVLFVIFHFIGG